MTTLNIPDSVNLADLQHQLRDLGLEITGKRDPYGALVVRRTPIAPQFTLDGAPIRSLLTVPPVIPPLPTDAS
jgi:hypothetical protein